MKTLNLWSREDELPAGAGPAELLFECADDGAIRESCGGAAALRDLVGERASTKESAFRLAAKLLDGEPAFRGVRQLGVFEELVVRELQHALHAVRLHAFAEENGFARIRFGARSRWAETLREVSRFRGGAVRVECGTSGRRAGPLHRGLRRLRGGGFSASSIRAEARLALDRLDPFHRRAAVAARWSRARPRAGALWFYTTAQTYTRIGLEYEPYFPEPFEFIVENPLTGGAPLREAGREGFDLYAFGGSDIVPTARETRDAAAAIRARLDAASLEPDEAAARAILLGSAWYGQFERRLLPQGLHHTALFERWAESARPAGLAVGNPCFEGYALRATRRAGVPTILLQHGVLGDYCQLVEPPVDHYVVRGSFWRDFLSPAARAKAAVLNLPGRENPAAQSRAGAAKHVLFATAPYDDYPFFHPSELPEIVEALVRAAARLGVPLLIRVHPREPVAFYRALVSRASRAAGTTAEVRFSQGGDERADVGGASAAVLFSSTLFLECLRLRVPVISFGWHDFPFKRQLERGGIFHFAENLAHLDRLVAAGAAGELAASEEIGEFLAPAEPARLSAALGAMLSRKGAS